MPKDIAPSTSPILTDARVRTAEPSREDFDARYPAKSTAPLPNSITIDAARAAYAPAIGDLVARAEAAEAKLADYERRYANEVAIDEAADDARARNAAPKLLGTIPVYDLDSPPDVLKRARTLQLGRVPIGRAKRFKTDAQLRAQSGWILHKRLGGQESKSIEVPLGTEFDYGDVPPQEVIDWHACGAVMAIG